jgi:DNA polymerase-3 subunit epsilon
MQPSVGSLLEIAWGWGRAQDKELQNLNCELVELPEGESIPSAVQAITGLVHADLTNAKPMKSVYQKLMDDYQKENETGLAIIHYAQFEKSFLKDFFLRSSGSEDLPFQILCSQALAKKLLPQLPSQNIRGLIGHFGSSLGELKRAGSHVQATFQIWKGLVEELEKRKIQSFEDIQKLLKTPLDKKADSKSKRYQYKIEDRIRLGLPQGPGIYKMLNKKNEILYIGKATCLRDRVNSYFRGKKGRDSRKLEMLTQVWDLQYVETETVLQASVLESDEIKKNNPPYNISLKTGRRNLIFYSRDFEEQNHSQNLICRLGPFRPNGCIEKLRVFVQSEKMELRLPFFYQEVPEDLLKSGFQFFCERHHLTSSHFLNLRKALATGLGLLRKSEESDTVDEQKSTDILTPEQVAAKFERMFLRAAMELIRSRQISRLLNSQIQWESEVGWKSLEIRNGKIQSPWMEKKNEFPWSNLSIVDYDRMSILLSEISKHAHRVEAYCEANLEKLHLAVRAGNVEAPSSEQNIRQPQAPA